MKPSLKWILVALVGIFVARARAQAPVADGAPPAQLAFNMASFLSAVHPMEHARDGRMPLLLWNTPLPSGNALVASRRSGALRKAVDQFAQRGIVPVVYMGWDWTPAGALALAQTLQEAGLPVFIQNAEGAFIESVAWKECPIWPEGPDASGGNKNRKWPCLPLVDPARVTEKMVALFRPFRDANIRVAGVFFDDEGLPHPWNGCYEAQLKDADCRAQYPPGALDSFESFKRYAYELRARVIREGLSDPIHAMFPGAIVGTFAEYASSAQTPFVGIDSNVFPPLRPGSDVTMPGLYAANSQLPKNIPAGTPLTQQRADEVYFHLLLRAASTCAANLKDPADKTPAKRFIPYVAQALYEGNDPRYHLAMSRPAWRELQWHLWLRGADGLFVFNLGFPKSGVTAGESFHSVEDVRAVYDALLPQRAFLDKGEPMTLAVPKPFAGEAVWSGLRLPERCLVHASSPTEGTQQVEIDAWPGVHVKLDAPPGGATYIVGEDGRAEPLPSK